MKNADRTMKAMLAYAGFVLMLSLSGIGFLVWVVIKVMAHFDII